MINKSTIKDKNNNEVFKEHTAKEKKMKNIQNNE